MSKVESKQHRWWLSWWLKLISVVGISAVFGALTVEGQNPASVSPVPEQTPVQALTNQANPARSDTLKGRQAGATGATDAAATKLQTTQLSSAQFFDPAGFTVERLAETGFGRRADLLAARQQLAVAEGRSIQAGLKPNPILDAEYGTPRFLAGDPEFDLSIGVSQVFETGGKRRKRVAVANLEHERVRAEVLALERQFRASIRAAYVRTLAAGRQLDTLERLIMANEELVRVTNARLREGDVAPLDLNLVQLEADRLRVQAITMRADLESELISLRTLVGFEIAEPLRIAPPAERPPRLDLSFEDATLLALRERADLRALRLSEELGSARLRLAEAQRKPNVRASARFSRNKAVLDLPKQLGEKLVAIDLDNELTFGVSIELPFFNKNQGEIASAVGERAQAVRQREFLEATIRRDVALAYRRYRAAAEAVVIYSTRIMPHAEENVTSIRAAYNLGEFSVLDVVNEQRRLIESETGYNEALRNYYGALAEIEAALGTTIPMTAFGSATTSILPDSVPSRFDSTKLERSLALSPSLPQSAASPKQSATTVIAPAITPLVKPVTHSARQSNNKPD